MTARKRREVSPETRAAYRMIENRMLTYTFAAGAAMLLKAIGLF